MLYQCALAFEFKITLTDSLGNICWEEYNCVLKHATYVKEQRSNSSKTELLPVDYPSVDIKFMQNGVGNFKYPYVATWPTKTKDSR